MREIYIDSRHRKEPYGNAYTVFIQTPLKNVTHVELVAATVPNTMYNITNGKNIITVNTNNYSISPGFYSSKGLYNAINAVCTELCMTLFENEGKYVFINSSPFTVSVNSSELLNITGFTSGTLTSTIANPTNGIYDSSLTGQYFVKSSNVMNLKNFGEYVFLDIEELRRPFELEAVSNPYTSENSSYFAVIPIDVPSASIKTFKELSDYKISVHYPQPIDQIDRLTIKWLDSLGNSINFNGVDENSFILRFHMKELPLIEFKEDDTVEKDVKKNPLQIVFAILFIAFLFIILIKRK